MTKADSLETYRKKRDFKKTKEPQGSKSKKSKQPIFVIQKHNASNLHYDLRIEVDGVLASWAVPKGPSTDPSEKRLAVRTEDHPMEYADFEGVIPEGEYGAGTVLVWDTGTYQNLRENKYDPSDMPQSLDEGKIEIRLEGKKISGGYNLIRTGPKKPEQERWLLMKADDDRADARRNPVSTQPESVKSGKKLEDIREEND